MYKVIGEKPFNTDTSKYIGGFTDEHYEKYEYYDFEGNNEYYQEGDECYQKLYKKENGDFFLVHKGPKPDIYCAHLGCSCYGNKNESSYGIIPLKFDMAQRWAEENLWGYEYENAFGKVTEDDDEIHVCISVSTEINNAILAYAKDNNITINNVYSLLLNKVNIK